MIRTKWILPIVFFLLPGASPVHAGLMELEDVFYSCSDADRYVQANFAGAFSNIESGGFNTAGGFPNTGGSDDSGVGFGGAIGLSKSFDTVRVRTEIEGMWRQDSSYVTDSFPGPPGPITFLYQVQSTDNWSAMSNLWLDVPVAEDLWLYGGGGIGAAGMNLSVNDGVVTGNRTQTNFAYQFGTGLILPVGANAELDLGYRFLDLGDTTIPLSTAFPAGDYTADMVSHQIMFCVRLFVR